MTTSTAESLEAARGFVTAGNYIPGEQGALRLARLLDSREAPLRAEIERLKNEVKEHQRISSIAQRAASEECNRREAAEERVRVLEATEKRCAELEVRLEQAKSQGCSCDLLNGYTCGIHSL